MMAYKCKWCNRVIYGKTRHDASKMNREWRESNRDLLPIGHICYFDFSVIETLKAAKNENKSKLL